MASKATPAAVDAAVRTPGRTSSIAVLARFAAEPPTRAADPANSAAAAVVDSAN
jgi:hypothetical protein